jgi:small subunit ribosomal protein S6
MRQYEVAYIVHPDLDETAFAEVNDRIQELIEKGDGKITNVDLWGKKRLAYEIRKQKEGNYVFLQTELPPTLCSELERNFALLEPIMRFMITQIEEE